MGLLFDQNGFGDQGKGVPMRTFAFTDQPMSKPVIKLWDHVGTGLVVPWPSGVLYSNQTGGIYCMTPEVEGIFIPVGNDSLTADNTLVSHETELRQHFVKAWGSSGAASGLNERDADFIDQLLRSTAPFIPYIKVDRTKLLESHEAWVYVLLDDDSSPGNVKSLFEGLGPFPRSAILTWANSD